MNFQRQQSIRVKATALEAYRACADVGAWHRFMPAVYEARTVSRSGADETIEITADAGSERLTWRSARSLKARQLAIDFQRIEPKAPFARMEGVWRFLRNGDETDILLEHKYVLSQPEKAEWAESAIKQNVTKDLEGLKQYLEARSSKRSRGCVVTGGSRGIGRAIAKRLMLDGHHVFLGARDQSSLERTSRELSAEVSDARISHGLLDVSNGHSVAAFFASAQAFLGSVECLVSNAGVGGGGATVNLPEEHWLSLIEVNLNGVYRCTMEFLKLAHADKLPWGRVVNIASTGGKQGVVNAAAYCAAKHGVVGLTKSLGLEYAKSGITFNAVCPGFVETDLAIGARERYAEIYGITTEEMKSRIEARVPIGRYVDPLEVADALMVFLGPHSDPLTAQTLNVCGGLGNY